ncbi:hypothetical protein [Paraburkholderia lacunae]|uniref:hypothetical protein n=1 Tax=Paraburkholderia lacunae TaxID=2211104 RepID=UPI000E0FD91F|nr:hypothetical protein [Paraburkholderia lacunae]
MSKLKKRTHLRIVRNEASPSPPLPQENAPAIVIEVKDGMLVTCQVDARIEDCGELLAGILMAQTAILCKMRNA